MIDEKIGAYHKNFLKLLRKICSDQKSQAENDIDV